MGVGDARIRWRGKAPSDTLRSNLRSMCKKEKSMMEVKCLVLGMIRTNCYIIYTDDTKKAVIIDPAADAKKIIREISDLSVVPEAVLLTHGHFDHMVAADALRKEYGIPVCILEEDAPLLEDATKNCSAIFFTAYVTKADQMLRDGQMLEFLDEKLQVIATPGHTIGSCCYYAKEEGMLFSGDTLFQGSIGRTDLPTAKPSKIHTSIREKLFVLPEDTVVFTGHGEETTIGEEKANNPYVC